MDEYGYETAIIVSDPLHMKRALLLAEDAGITAYSSPTPTTRYVSLRTKIPFLYAASHKEVKRNLAGTGVLNHAGSDSFRDSLPIFKGMRICPT